VSHLHLKRHRLAVPTLFFIAAGMVTFAALPITARLTSIAARHIISDIGSYFAVTLI
jgi:hypothetical protein